MNNFNPTLSTGGMPLKQNDLTFIQAAFKEALKGILGGLMGPVASGQIHGAQVADAGSNWHVSEGFVAYNGEIWYVAAADVTKVTGTRLYFVPDISWDPAGSKTYENADIHDTRQIRRMTLAVATSLPDNSFEIFAPYNFDLTYYLMASLQDYFTLKEQNPWVNANLLNGWAIPAGANKQRLRYRMEPDGNHVEINGWVRGDSATFLLICVLPVGYRPSSHLEMPIIEDTTTFTHGRLFIDSATGGLNLEVTLPTSQEICINVRYPIV